jgi:hypothetical protein
MGMQMSNQTMDMNEVMYPEISGEEDKKGKDQMRSRVQEHSHHDHSHAK